MSIIKKHDISLGKNGEVRILQENSYSTVIDEIEKLYENHIKIGTVEGYDKSKFKIFPTWEVTKEVSEISEEVFLGLINENYQCTGFNGSNGFINHCSVVTCYECILASENTKADIIKWMEETK